MSSLEKEDIDFGDDVDEATFEQILEMDDEDDDTREFSQSIVLGFLEQAEATFLKMDAAMAAKDLAELSSLGHFLKGSSATLGYTKIKDECEKIQNYGHGKDEAGEDAHYSNEKALVLIAESLVRAKDAFRRIDRIMRRYYAQ